MRIVTFIKSLAVLTVPAALGVALAPPKGLANIAAAFLQLEAIALAGAIVYALAVPPLFGVRKGEQVLLITQDPVSGSISVRLAVALTGGKVHQDIKIAMGRSEVTATVESYSGLITPARVSVKPENTISVI